MKLKENFFKLTYLNSRLLEHRGYKGFQNSPKLELSKLEDMLDDNTGYKLSMYVFEHKPNFDAILRFRDDWGSPKDFYDKHHKELINCYRSLVDELDGIDGELKLYRGIIIIGTEEPDLKDTGVCWTNDQHIAEEFIEGINDIDDPNFASAIIEATFQKKDIDVIYSVCARLDEPSEKEIRIFKDSKPLDIDYYVL